MSASASTACTSPRAGCRRRRIRTRRRLGVGVQERLDGIRDVLRRGREIGAAEWLLDALDAHLDEVAAWQPVEEERVVEHRREVDAAAATALRFTLSVPGVHTAIVGTTKPERWMENAASLEAGRLEAEAFERIRARWREVANPSWDGQV